MSIAIEGQELVLERTGKNTFKVTLGDLDMGVTPEKIKVRIGDSIRLYIPSILVMESAGKRKVCEIHEVYT